MLFYIAEVLFLSSHDLNSSVMYNYFLRCNGKNYLRPTEISGQWKKEEDNQSKIGRNPSFLEWKRTIPHLANVIIKAYSCKKKWLREKKWGGEYINGFFFFLAISVQLAGS